MKKLINMLIFTLSLLSVNMSHLSADTILNAFESIMIKEIYE